MAALFVSRIYLVKMSQQQHQKGEKQEPIKYGDVFKVSGELATCTITMQDANMMQTAETTVLGKSEEGRAASLMQSAAAQNERAGFVDHSEVGGAAKDRGMTVTETQLSGSRVVTEFIAGQVVAQYVKAAPVPERGAADQNFITIGQALEATALTAGNKPVEDSDAAAIQAAETIATGTNTIQPGGVAAMAQSAASFNAGLTLDGDKIKLIDVLKDVSNKLQDDRTVKREDVERVERAELRNNPRLAMYPGGVADSVATAAGLNEKASEV